MTWTGVLFIKDERRLYNKNMLLSPEWRMQCCLYASTTQPLISPALGNGCRSGAMHANNVYLCECVWIMVWFPSSGCLAHRNVCTSSPRQMNSFIWSGFTAMFDEPTHHFLAYIWNPEIRKHAAVSRLLTFLSETPSIYSSIQHFLCCSGASVFFFFFLLSATSTNRLHSNRGIVIAIWHHLFGLGLHLTVWVMVVPSCRFSETEPSECKGVRF